MEAHKVGVPQEYVIAALESPDSEADRLMLADAFEEEGDPTSAGILRKPGSWQVGLKGEVCWAKVGGGFVRFANTRSEDVPSMMCGCKKRTGLVRRQGVWLCWDCELGSFPSL